MTGVRFLFSHCIFLYPPHPATPSPSKQREKLQSMQSMSFICLHIKQSDSVLCGGGDFTTEWILFLPFCTTHQTRRVNFWELQSTRTYKTLVQRRNPVTVIFFFFGCAAQLAGSHFPNQGLNSGPSSESIELQPLDHQGTPICYSILNTSKKAHGPQESTARTFFWYRNPAVANNFQSQFSSISLTISRNSSRNPARGCGSYFPLVHYMSLSFAVSSGVLQRKAGRGCVRAQQPDDTGNVVFCK